ncbi:hypothetical protein SVAN01_11714 [Stagonosporopsis vannaccii]|nr:hypothetical protein SVAN01_11714 [Stagonosporopsis vannaccii]
MAVNNALMRAQSAHLDGELLGLVADMSETWQLSDDERRSLVVEARDKTGFFNPASLQTITAEEQRQIRMYELYLIRPRLVGLDFFGIKTWKLELKAAIDDIRLRSWGIDSFTLAYMALRRQLPMNEMFITPDWSWDEIQELITLESEHRPHGVTFLVIEEGIWKPLKLDVPDEKLVNRLDDGSEQRGLSAKFANYIMHMALRQDVPKDGNWDAKFTNTDASAPDGLLIMARVCCMMRDLPQTEAEKMLDSGFEDELLDGIGRAIREELTDSAFGGRENRISDVEKIRQRLQKRRLEVGNNREKPATVEQSREDPLSESDESE